MLPSIDVKENLLNVDQISPSHISIGFSILHVMKLYVWTMRWIEKVLSMPSRPEPMPAATAKDILDARMEQDLAPQLFLAPVFCRAYNRSHSRN